MRFLNKTFIFALEMKNIFIHINRSQRALINDSLKGFYPLKRSGCGMYLGLVSNN